METTLPENVVIQGTERETQDVQRSLDDYTELRLEAEMLVHCEQAVSTPIPAEDFAVTHTQVALVMSNWLIAKKLERLNDAFYEIMEFLKATR